MKRTKLGTRVNNMFPCIGGREDSLLYLREECREEFSEKMPKKLSAVLASGGGAGQEAGFEKGHILLCSLSSCLNTVTLGKNWVQVLKKNPPTRKTAPIYND